MRYSLPAGAGLVPAGKLSLPVKLTRPATAETVRLTLLTNQTIPLVNNQPDIVRALRPEKPVELATKITEGVLTVLVPAELAGANYEVAIQAEDVADQQPAVDDGGLKPRFAEHAGEFRVQESFERRRLFHVGRFDVMPQRIECHATLDEMLIAVAQAMAPAAPAFLGREGNAELPQVGQLVDERRRGRGALVQRPGKLAE